MRPPALGGPRTGAHRIDPDALAGLGVGIGHGGVVVGFRADGEPVTAQLFRNRPTQVATLCTGFTARLLAFRALATGAAVEVTSPRTTAWTPLLSLQPAGAVTRAASGADPLAAATPRRPVLRCEDGVTGTVAPWPGLSAWQTRVAAPAAVTPAAVSGLTGFDLVLLRRLPPDVVHPVQLALTLADDVADLLPRLPNDSLVAVADGQALVLSLGLTSVELSVLGPPGSGY
jgi:hypothetical protein